MWGLGEGSGWMPSGKERRVGRIVLRIAMTGNEEDGAAVIFRSKCVVFSLFASWLVACVLAPAAAGQTDAEGSSSGEYKIGVVNLKDAFDAYEKQKGQYKKLQEERDTRQVEIDALSDRITKAKERYEAEKDTMSAEDREVLEESIESDFGRYKAEFKRLQEEIDRKEKRLLEDVFKDIHRAIAEVGAQGNYHLVFEGGESGRSGLLYYGTPLNMTQQVVDYLNAEYDRS